MLGPIAPVFMGVESLGVFPCTTDTNSGWKPTPVIERLSAPVPVY